MQLGSVTHVHRVRFNGSTVSGVNTNLLIYLWTCLDVALQRNQNLTEHKRKKNQKFSVNQSNSERVTCTYQSIHQFQKRLCDESGQRRLHDRKDELHILVFDNQLKSNK